MFPPPYSLAGHQPTPPTSVHFVILWSEIEKVFLLFCVLHQSENVPGLVWHCFHLQLQQLNHLQGIKGFAKFHVIPLCLFGQVEAIHQKVKCASQLLMAKQECATASSNLSHVPTCGTLNALRFSVGFSLVLSASASPALFTWKVNFINCCPSFGGRQSKALNLISNTRCFSIQSHLTTCTLLPFCSLTAIRIDAPRCASAFRSHNWVTQQMEMETELEAEALVVGQVGQAQQLPQRAAQVLSATRVPAPAPVASVLPPYIATKEQVAEG